MILIVSLQKQVDKAETFPYVLDHVTEWMEERRLGSDKSFAVVTDGYVKED